MAEPLEGSGNKYIIHYTILDADECGRPPSDPYFNKNEKSALHTIAISNNKVIIGLRVKVGLVFIFSLCACVCVCVRGGGGGGVATITF